jgi:hypothetical protein
MGNKKNRKNAKKSQKSNLISAEVKATDEIKPKSPNLPKEGLRNLTHEIAPKPVPKPIPV